jgi:hypothetical protein
MRAPRLAHPRTLTAVASTIFVVALASVPAKAPSATLASVAAKAQPSAPCTAGLTRLDVRIGGGIPWPPTFSNPTSSTVRFTVRLAKSWFFGPARDIGTVTLPPHTGRISSLAVPTFLHTPLGVGNVVIEVRTDHTGAEIVGRCNYQLHLQAPRPTEVGTLLSSEKRWLYQVPVQLCAIEGSDLAGAAKPGADRAARRPSEDVERCQRQDLVSAGTDSVLDGHRLCDPGNRGSVTPLSGPSPPRRYGR